MKILDKLFFRKIGPEKNNTLNLTPEEILYILKERAIKNWLTEIEKNKNPKRKLLLKILKP